MNVRLGKYLAVVNDALTTTITCDDGEFRFDAIDTHTLEAGLYTIKSNDNSHYLSQKEDTNVEGTTTVGIWEFVNNAIENQHTHQYLTMNNLDVTHTSHSLDSWLRVVHDAGNELYCLLNLNNGLYLNI